MTNQSNIYYHAGAQVANLALYFLIAAKAQGVCSSTAVLTATALQYIRSNQVNDQQDRYLCKASIVFVAAGCLFSRTGGKVGGISLVYFATSFEAIHYHRPKRIDLPSFQDRTPLSKPTESVTETISSEPKQKPTLSSNQYWDEMIRQTHAMRSAPLPGKVTTARVGAPPVVLPPRTFCKSHSLGLSARVLSKGVGPTGLKGIPNYSSNCFVISAYQMVRSNPSLYNAIFSSETFKADKRFDALREFDLKYASGSLLTVLDMQKVRTECLTKFGILSYGHQDAYEVLTLAFFNHLPPTSTVRSTAVYEFTVPTSEVEATLRGMVGVEVVKRTTIPARWLLSSEQVSIQVRTVFPLERASSWSVSLDGADAGIQMGDAIRRDLTEGRSRETFKLSPLVVGTQVSREFTFLPGDEVTIALKRFDNFGNKISTKVSVPRGEIQIDEGRPHEVKGFIIHKGSTKRSGHYLEYQKVGEKWYLNNDPRSTQISTEDAIKAMEEAYVFYAERA